MMQSSDSESSGGIADPDFDTSHNNDFVDSQDKDQFMLDEPFCSQLLFNFKKQFQLDRVRWEDIFNHQNIQREEQIEELLEEERRMDEEKQLLLKEIEELSIIKRNIQKELEGREEIKRVVTEGKTEAVNEYVQENQKLVEEFKGKDKVNEKVLEEMKKNDEKYMKAKDSDLIECNNALALIKQFKQIQQQKNQMLLLKKKQAQERFLKQKTEKQAEIERENAVHWKKAEDALKLEISQKTKYLNKLISYNEAKKNEKRGKQQQYPVNQEFRVSGEERGKQTIVTFEELQI